MASLLLLFEALIMGRRRCNLLVTTEGEGARDTKAAANSDVGEDWKALPFCSAFLGVDDDVQMWRTAESYTWP